MRWRRTDAVQEVGALLAVGLEAVQHMGAAMAAKPPLLRQLPVQRGEDWAVIFAAAVDGGSDPVLPHLDRLTALYETAPGWWLPVGVRLDAPDHVRGDLLRALSRANGFEPPAIVAPRFTAGADEADEADVFVVRRPQTSLALAGDRHDR